MADAPNLSYAIGLPPTEAIAYFEKLGYRISRNAVQAYNAAQARAFTVTGITRMDVLQDVKAGLDKALRDGTTFGTFQNETNDLLRRRGWLRGANGTQIAPQTGEVVATLPPRRMQTIFRTNMQSALMAGKYQQLMDDVAIAPYWQYVAIMDSRTRPSHAAANGRIFRHDDPFWSSHFPPCDFECRCGVRSLRQRDIERRDLVVSDSAGMLEETEINVGRQTRPAVAFVDKATRTRFVPGPGFGRRPIQEQQTLGQVLGQKLEQVQPRISARVVQAQPGLVKPLADEYTAWANDVLQLGRARNTYRVIATMTPQIVKVLQAKDYVLDSAAVSVRDAELLHLVRDAKQSRRAALTQAQVLALPQLVAGARAVLWDVQDPALIYVLDVEGQDALKAVVRVNWETRVRDADGRASQKMNSVRTAGKVKLGDLKSKRYELLEGNLDE